MARPRDPKSALISEEAAEWFVRVKDDALGAAERRQYVRWLKQSSTHAAEMLRMRQLARWLRNAKLEGSITAQASTSNVIAFASRSPTAPGDTSDRDQDV